jgi:hypothetical protein
MFHLAGVRGSAVVATVLVEVLFLVVSVVVQMRIVV